MKMAVTETKGEVTLLRVQSGKTLNNFRPFFYVFNETRNVNTMFTS